MYIKGGIITGYRYEIWYDSSCLHEDDDVFDTEKEARAEAEAFCLDRIEQWKLDGGYNGETIDDFNINIIDVIEEEGDEDDE